MNPFHSWNWDEVTLSLIYMRKALLIHLLSATFFYVIEDFFELYGSNELIVCNPNK